MLYEVITLHVFFHIFQKGRIIYTPEFLAVPLTVHKIHIRCLLFGSIFQAVKDVFRVRIKGKNRAEIGVALVHECQPVGFDFGKP